MSSSKKLGELRRGDAVDGIYLVETANFKQARNGKPFLQLVLRDATAAVKAVRWETSREEFRALERCAFLAAKGRAEEFQGNLQIVVDGFEPISEEDARIDPQDFLPRSRHDIAGMARALDQIILSISNPAIRSLVQKVLERPEVAEGLRLAPAGKSMHHAYVGGLLEHVLSLARLAIRVVEHYPWLDRSLLLAGVVLHDIGKVRELSYKTGFGYTDEGQLLGHIVIALGWIDESAKAVPDLPEGTLLEIKHLVTSHHGQLEYGSPRVPMTGEAVALHFIDNLDAKLAGLQQTFQDLPAERRERWSDYSHLLGTRLYFPPRMDQLSKEFEGQALEDTEDSSQSADASPSEPAEGSPQGELRF